MAFGISPDTLALRPQTLIQDRAANRSRAQQAAQYASRRQDAADRFAQSMASQEANRKARFAELQFRAEQDLLRDRAKTKASLLDDIAKENERKQADIQKRAISAAEAQIRAGNATYDQYNQLIGHFTAIYSGQAPPPMQPPQPQPQAIEPVQPMQEGMQEPMQEAPYTEMYPYGTEGDQVLGTQEPETPIARELTLDEINQQVLEEAAIAKQAQAPVKPAPKEEIPEVVRKSTYVKEYRRKKNNIKNATKASKPIDKEIVRLEKLIKSPAMNFNRNRNKANLKALKTRREKITKNLETNQNRIDEIGRLAGKEREAKLKKQIEKLSLTKKISIAENILKSKDYGEEIYTPKQVKWAKNLMAKHTGGTGTQQADMQDEAIAQRIQQARSEGITDEQITEMLIQKGLDPATYGLR